jgi:hypothetical protein
MLANRSSRLVGTLPEQTEIAHIQEELKQAKRIERFGYVVGLISMLIFWWVIDFYLEIVVGLVIALCLGLSFYYASKGAKLRKQLKVIGFGQAETTQKG